MRASQFAEIYREASTDLRERETEEVFVNKLREVRARLGDIVGVEKSYPSDLEDAERGWFLNSFVVKGTAEEGQELFAWDVSGAEFKLDRYRIRFKQGTELINLTP